MRIRLAVAPLLVAAAAAAAGCASTKQYVALPDQAKTVEDPSKARIYVYRPSLVGSAIPMDVSDNDQVIGHTGARGYLCWERPPGSTTLRSSAENTAELPLQCESGKVYYVGQHARMGWFLARTNLTLQPEEEGKKKLADCKPPEVEIRR